MSSSISSQPETIQAAIEIYRGRRVTPLRQELVAELLKDPELLKTAAEVAGFSGWQDFVENLKEVFVLEHELGRVMVQELLEFIDPSRTQAAS